MTERHPNLFVANLSVLPIACAVFAISCSSAPTASDPPAGTDSTGDDARACEVSSVSFEADVTAVFAEGCNTSTCHGVMGNGLAENLYLGPGASEGGPPSSASDVAAIYAELVGVKSLEDPAMDLVKAGDPDNSYLWHKIQSDPNADSAVVTGCATATSGPAPCSDCIPSAPCGAEMPIGVPLDPSAICKIKIWITDGAMNN